MTDEGLIKYYYMGLTEGSHTIRVASGTDPLAYDEIEVIVGPCECFYSVDFIRGIDLSYHGETFPNFTGAEGALSGSIGTRLEEGSPIIDGDAIVAAYLMPEGFQYQPGTYDMSVTFDDDDEDITDRLLTVGSWKVQTYESNNMQASYFGTGNDYGALFFESMVRAIDFSKFWVLIKVKTYVTAPFNSKNPLNNLKSCAD
jgi:hypothetical protein